MGLMPNITGIAGILSIPGTGSTAIRDLPPAALAEVKTVTSGQTGSPDLLCSSG
jgi:hypothetical protein